MTKNVETVEGTEYQAKEFGFSSLRWIVNKGTRQRKQNLHQQHIHLVWINTSSPI